MWQEKDNSLYKKFEFDNFEEAVEFINKIAEIAIALDHHPKIVNTYSTVELFLTTHSADDKVTSKDKEFASRVDELTKAEIPGKISTTRAKLYSDGGSRGNPGPSAIGYAIYDENDQPVKEEGRYIGLTTNNQAEYLGVKEGLISAKKLGVHEIQVYMDSLLVVNQMNGIYKVKNRDLWPIHETVKELAANFKKISFHHVPRELNKVADGLVNKTLDNQ